MKRTSVILLSAAAVLWGAGIGIDAAGGRMRIWIPMFGAACAVTIAGFNMILAANAARSNQSLATAVLQRPYYRGDTGPLAAIPPQPAASGQPVQLSAHGSRRARHASR